jgi:hypothetical protein
MYEERKELHTPSTKKKKEEMEDIWGVLCV